MDPFLIEVPVPSMGATVHELTIIDIKVVPGEHVAKGQKLAELESDKSVFEFEAPAEGVVVELRARAGDIVPAGSPFVRLRTADVSQSHLRVSEAVATPASSVLRAPAPVSATASAPARASAAAVRPLATASASAAAPAAKLSPAPATTHAAVAAPAAPKLLWTPRAVKLAEEAGLDPVALQDVPATGPGGRVSGDDFQRYLATRPAPVAVAPTPVPGAAARAASPVADETVCIAGVGSAVPKGVRSNAEILRAFPDKTEAEILKLTGIQERRYAAEGETATSLAVIAARQALAQAGLAATEIDGIIMATLIPDQPVPAMASALARELGCVRALAFDLNAACSGWLYGLEVGRAFIKGGTARRLLVVTAELLSRITNPADHQTAFLFGDGAGAAVLTDAPDGHRLHRMALSGDATEFAAIQRPGGGATRPFPDPAGADRDDFYLQMNGPAVFKHAVIGFADQIEATLQRHALRPEDIAWIVPHQANERILRAVAKRVGIPYEKFVVTIAKFGNTSAASVSMALGWAAREEIFHPGDRIIFCSVGGGLTFAGGLLVW